MKILNTHPTFVYANDIKEICHPLKSLDVDYFSHVMVDENGKFSAIGTCPEFAELYYKKKYYNFDIHRSPLYQGQNYIVWDSVERDPDLDEVYDDFKCFALGHSFTIAYEDLDGCKHYYDFSAKLGNESINHKYLNNLGSLKVFILYFNEQINSNRNLKKGHEIKFVMKKHDKPGDENSNQLALPINRIYFSNNIYLTLREFQCLDYLSQGKTINEISVILSITLRTAKAHIGNIKNKLGCKNLFQLGVVYQAWKDQF